VSIYFTFEVNGGNKKKLVTHGSKVC